MTAKKTSFRDRPWPTGEPFPAVCTVSDVCRIVRMSASQFWALRKRGTFPIPEIQPPIDHRVRFRGEDVQAYVEGRFARHTRKRRTAA